MPNPTREDIIEAHKALTNLLKLASSTSTASAIFNEQIVRDALPPKPKPSIAEIGWDKSLHRLAEAHNPLYGYVTMLRQMNAGVIEILNCSGGKYSILYSNPEDLTPTGKRYELKEIQE